MYTARRRTRLNPPQRGDCNRGEFCNWCGYVGFPLFLVYGFLVTGFASPYWVTYKNRDTNIETHQGLWRICTNTGADTSFTCINAFDNDSDAIPDWLPAAQALMISAVITLVLSTGIFLYYMGTPYKKFFVKFLFFVLFIVTLVLGASGIILYGVKGYGDQDDNTNFAFGWSFYFADISCCILLVTLVLMWVLLKFPGPSPKTAPPVDTERYRFDRVGLRDTRSHEPSRPSLLTRAERLSGLDRPRSDLGARDRISSLLELSLTDLGSRELPRRHTPGTYGGASGGLYGGASRSLYGGASRGAHGGAYHAYSSRF